ncbi:2Fe-2S iron-sulfur cluster-binding protein [Sphingomonas sp.]|uniref:2Fe-2S iron-sulfur cluster-binding protein n=1 Tax=Sphingomonas sp. TaxID=28214 RepID=UPI0031DC3F39
MTEEAQPRVRVTARDGVRHEACVTPGMTLLEAVRLAGCGDLLGICGGIGLCGTCHLYVSDGSAPLLPPAEADERSMLEDMPHRTLRSRLACQLVVPQGPVALEVQIAPVD